MLMRSSGSFAFASCSFALSSALVGFEKVETVGVNKQFIEGLSGLVYQALKNDRITPDGGYRLCPKNWENCCQNIEKIMNTKTVDAISLCNCGWVGWC